MSKLLSHEEAVKKSLKVKWKVSLCDTGESCWCRIVEPVEPIEIDGGSDLYILPAASIHREHAEHIVEIHNESL